MFSSFFHFGLYLTSRISYIAVPHFFFKRICTNFALNLVLQRSFNTVLDSLIRLSKLPIGNIWKSETNHLSL